MNEKPSLSADFKCNIFFDLVEYVDYEYAGFTLFLFSLVQYYVLIILQ